MLWEQAVVASVACAGVDDTAGDETPAGGSDDGAMMAATGGEMTALPEGSATPTTTVAARRRRRQTPIQEQMDAAAASVGVTVAVRAWEVGGSNQRGGRGWAVAAHGREGGVRGRGTRDESEFGS